LTAAADDSRLLSFLTGQRFSISLKYFKPKRQFPDGISKPVDIFTDSGVD